MLYELSRDEHQRIRHLACDSTNLEARAVISGNNPGWIFVDNKETPQTALLWAKGNEGFYLMGSHANADFNEGLNDFVDEIIKPRSLALGYTWFEVSGTKDEWNEVIESLFYRRGLHQWTQRVYTHNRRLVPGTRPLLDPTMRLASLDKKLLTSDLKNLNIVTAELERYWDSLSHFYEKGFGYAIIGMGLVASLCFSSFVDKDEFQVGLKSYDPLERDALPRAVAVEFVRHVLSKRGYAYWDCTETHVATYRMAESLGFSRAWDYQCHGFQL